MSANPDDCPGARAVRLIEALLFVRADPTPRDDLAHWLRISAEAVDAALERLKVSLEGHGLVLVEMGGGVALATAPDLDPDLAPALERAQDTPEPLSQGAWETLSIVAYRQPVTRLEIEAIRQVGSERALATLVDRGLVEEIGRKEAPGRPILYGTTAAFLRQFGLRRIEDLPPLPAPPPV
jgi:segregation and condensation protein B